MGAAALAAMSLVTALFSAISSWLLKLIGLKVESLFPPPPLLPSDLILHAGSLSHSRFALRGQAEVTLGLQRNQTKSIRIHPILWDGGPSFSSGLVLSHQISFSFQYISSEFCLRLAFLPSPPSPSPQSPSIPRQVTYFIAQLIATGAFVGLFFARSLPHSRPRT